MPRGKRGPYPQMKVTAESGIAVTDESPEDPTAEDIVGAENVVNIDHLPASDSDDDPPPLAGYKCANCIFRSEFLSEMEEHVNGTGHGKFDTEDGRRISGPVIQPELFRPPGTISKSIQIPFDAEFLTEKRERLANLYQKALDVKSDKKSADAGFNARLTDLDEQMQEIARVLRFPYTYETKECEWRLIEGENARALYRLDTGEEIERSPLTQEDFQAEHEQAEAANAAPEVAEAIN